MARSKVYSITSEEFKEVANNAKTLKEILEYVELSHKGHSYDILKKRLIEEGIDFSTKYKQIETIKYDKNINIFVEKSTFTSNGGLKKIILDNNYKEYKCVKCGNTGEHCGEKLVLQLDHINGIHNDHRLENLRFLCPNCHSQTETYSGKNANTGPRPKNIDEELLIKVKSKYKECLDCGKLISIRNKKDVCIKCNIIKNDGKCNQCGNDISKYGKNGICINCYEPKRKFEVNRDELIKLIKEKPMSEIGKMFGVSDSAVKKRCNVLQIEIPPMRGYWAKIRSKNVS